MSKISQGEWLQMSSSEHKRAIYAHGTGFICFLPNAATDGLTGEFQANQDLIAAAPELLSSAEAVWKNAFAGFTSPEEKKKLISDLAAAVSKARGYQ